MMDLERMLERTKSARDKNSIMLISAEKDLDYQLKKLEKPNTEMIESLQSFINATRIVVNGYDESIKKMEAKLEAERGSREKKALKEKASREKSSSEESSDFNNMVPSY